MFSHKLKHEVDLISKKQARVETRNRDREDKKL